MVGFEGIYFFKGIFIHFWKLFISKAYHYSGIPSAFFFKQLPYKDHGIDTGVALVWHARKNVFPRPYEKPPLCHKHAYQ